MLPISSAAIREGLWSLPAHRDQLIAASRAEGTEIASVTGRQWTGNERPDAMTLLLLGYVAGRTMILSAAGLTNDQVADWGEAFRDGWDDELGRHIAARKAGLGTLTVTTH